LPFYQKWKHSGRVQHMQGQGLLEHQHLILQAQMIAGCQVGNCRLQLQILLHAVCCRASLRDAETHLALCLSDLLCKKMDYACPINCMGLPSPEKNNSLRASHVYWMCLCQLFVPVRCCLRVCPCAGCPLAPLPAP